MTGSDVSYVGEAIAAYQAYADTVTNANTPRGIGPAWAVRDWSEMPMREQAGWMAAATEVRLRVLRQMDPLPAAEPGIDRAFSATVITVLTGAILGASAWFLHLAGAW